MIKVSWTNFETGETETILQEGETLQLTYTELRNEEGDSIAYFDNVKDRWIRISDNRQFTDIAWVKE